MGRAPDDVGAAGMLPGPAPGRSATTSVTTPNKTVARAPMAVHAGCSSNRAAQEKPSLSARDASQDPLSSPRSPFDAGSDVRRYFLLM